MKYKVYSAREVERLLKNNGFHASRQKGTHIIWERITESGEQHITIPRSYDPMILRREFKKYNLKEE